MNAVRVYIYEELHQETLALAIYHSNDLGKKYTPEYLIKSYSVILSLMSDAAPRNAERSKVMHEKELTKRELVLMKRKVDARTVHVGFPLL